MTESDIWNRIKKWLPGYRVRIENALTAGLSDVLWCPNGRSVFLELKVQYGKGSIYIRNSQIVFGIHAAESVPSHQHMFLVGTIAHQPLVCYNYATIARCPSIVTKPGVQKFFIGDAVPDRHWSGAKDVSDFIQFMEKEARDGTVI